MKKVEDELFKEGLKEEDLIKIRKISKGDVHNHCGLGMRFSTFNKWAGGNVNKPPKKIDGLKGLDNYIFNETMKYINKHIRTYITSIKLHTFNYIKFSSHRS